MGVGHWLGAIGTAVVASVASVLVANKVVSGSWTGPASTGKPSGTSPPNGAGWTVLDPTQEIQLTPGGWYAIVAMVKSTHSEADIASLAAKYGLVFEQVEDPASPLVPPLPDADAGYRYFACIVQATTAGTLPVKVPWFVPGDSSHVVLASVGA
jgi:hypothetical protein